jgi:hypothetical protein
LNSRSPLQIGKIAPGVAIGIAGATLITDASVERLGVWGVPLALVVVGVSIALYGMLAPYKNEKRAKILRGLIAFVFVADVVCLVAPYLTDIGASAVAFWRRWALSAHFIVILIVVFEADAFLNKKREK